MDLGFLSDTLLQLIAGIPLMVQLAFSSITLGTFLGLAIALMRLSRATLLVKCAWLYVQIIRSIPLLVLLFLTYYGLSQFKALRESVLWLFFREPYWCALLAMTVNTSAFVSEIIRGGLLSVPYSEIEAARAFGMSRLLLFRRLILPVAVRQALPAYSNEVIIMVKATSLASLVTLMEVTGIASRIAAETYRVFEVFAAAGVIYLITVFLLVRCIMVIEYRLTPHLRAQTYPGHYSPATQGDSK
jgi:octopine/nopaline transport system permease protein